MKILAMDTSSAVAAVAVMDDGRLLGEYSINHKKTHSQKLMPMVEELMESLELKLKDIDMFAASTGPGSFTGLRIGVTTVKALAYAAKKPVISVPTLDALAYNISACEGLVCPIMDARNGQVYTAVYKWQDGILSRLTEYMGLDISELIVMLKEKKQKVVFVGDALEVHNEYIKKEMEEYCIIAPGNLMLQKASSVAQAAFIKASSGDVENSFELIPFYLRKSQAERELEKRLGV